MFQNQSNMLRVIIFAYVVSLIECGVPSLGSCPPLRGISSFDVSRYTGTWYEYSNVFEVFQVGGVCVRATYTDNGDGSVRLINEQVNQLTGQYISINGTAKLADPAFAELVVNFDTVPVQFSKPNYKVVDTDYENYAIVYNCVNILGFFKTENLWFLTRQQIPDQQIVDQGYAKMTNLGLPVSKLKQTPQTECNNLPSLQ